MNKYARIFVFVKFPIIAVALIVSSRVKAERDSREIIRFEAAESKLIPFTSVPGGQIGFGSWKLRSGEDQIYMYDFGIYGPACVSGKTQSGCLDDTNLHLAGHTSKTYPRGSK